MAEEKRCWQVDYLPQPTPCFKKAGDRPCESPGCPVDDRIQELKTEDIPINQGWIELLSHSRCRLSSLSSNNHEYWQRLSPDGS